MEMQADGKMTEMFHLVGMAIVLRKNLDELIAKRKIVKTLATMLDELQKSLGQLEYEANEDLEKLKALDEAREETRKAEEHLDTLVLDVQKSEDILLPQMQDFLEGIFNFGKEQQ